MKNVVGPIVVAMATKFWLGAEIQSPTGLLISGHYSVDRTSPTTTDSSFLLGSISRIFSPILEFLHACMHFLMYGIWNAVSVRFRPSFCVSSNFGRPV